MAPLPIPRLGILITFQARQDLGERWDTVYRESLELAAEAGRLGVDDIWVSEHHGEADGYCPSPIVAGAALATAAPACRIGQGIAIAPLHGHPLRLAEDLAVLDNLSGGRLDIGLGQGYRPAEFEAMDLSYGQRTRSFEETLDVLTRAWSGERFDYAGAIHRVRGGWLRPAPVRPGPPPLWIGAAAPVSRARAVRHRAGLIVAPLTELAHTARQFAAFDAEAGRQSAPPLPHALLREIMVGDSAAEAIARHRPSLDFIYRVQYAPERTGLTRVDPASGERRPLTGDDPYYLSEAFIQERWFAGTPEEVAAKIVAWQPKLRLDRLVFQPRMPGMTLADSVDDLRRVAAEVMPRVRNALAQP